MTETATWLAELQEASFAGANSATVGSFPPERRLTGEQLVKVLTTRRNTVVSTTRRDGRPHSTPSAFVLFGQSIWLPVVAKAVRARNVARQPWVSLVIAEGAKDTHGVVIMEGAAVLAEKLPEGMLEAAKDKLDSVSWVEQWIHLTPAKLLSYASPGWREDPA